MTLSENSAMAELAGEVRAALEAALDALRGAD